MAIGHKRVHLCDTQLTYYAEILSFTEFDFFNLLIFSSFIDIWDATLYKFKVYTIMMWCMYVLQMIATVNLVNICTSYNFFSLEGNL